MIIAFSGDLGSGKSTIAKRVADEFKIPRFYMGQILRDLARDRGVTLVEFLKMGETDSSIDRDADDYVLKIAKENESFLIESRTAWHFIPNSIKIYFKVDPKEGARRIYEDIKKDDNRNEDRDINSVEDVLESNKKRMLGDIGRYKKYYNIDISNLDNYDFVVDTTNLSRDEVFEKVVNFLAKFKNI